MNEIPKTYYRVSIKGLVLDENREKFLIILEDSGYWELPGGGLDSAENESIEQCLRREVMEEMGLNVIEVAKHPTYVLVGLNMKGNQSINLVYEMKLENLDFVPSDECREIKFVTPEEAIAMNSWRNVKELALQFKNIELGKA